MTQYSEFYSGEKLYGDDFTSEEISRWFEEESEAYFKLAASTFPNPQEQYLYRAINELYGFRYIQGRRFTKCLGLGVGGAQDVKGIAHQVDEFYCVEPAKEWWRDDIAGAPAKFVSPNLDASIDLRDGTCDLAVSLGVLHHIPNVTAVVKEISRVLEPGGIMIVREPIVSMGDWSKPRLGATKNERGIPLQIFRSTMKDAGFDIVNEQLCTFRPFILFMRRAFNVTTYNNEFMTRIDGALSSLTQFNYRYFRSRLHHHFAPSAIFGVYRKL